MQISEIINTWLPPVVIVGVLGTLIMLTNKRITDLGSGLNKRIDDLGKNVSDRIGDLRNQMTREHDTLANRVDKLETDLSVKIDGLTERYISHLEHHTTQSTLE